MQSKAGKWFMKGTFFYLTNLKNCVPKINLTENFTFGRGFSYVHFFFIALFYTYSLKNKL